MGKLGIWRPVTRYQSGDLRIKITPRRLVFHTAVSSASSMHDFFNTPGQATPHFYVNKEGEIEQYIDTGYRATACLDGNHDCIAVESWDAGAPGGQVPEWTPKQVEACAKIAAFCKTHHDIPLDRCPNSKPGSRGVGWHRLGIDGNFPDPPGGLLGGRVSGGERWSESGGKICPGDKKIRGVVNDIIPLARQLLTDGDDMQLDDDLYPGDDKNKTTVGDALRRADHIDEFRAAVADRFDKSEASLKEAKDAIKAQAADIDKQTEKLDKALDLLKAL